MEINITKLTDVDLLRKANAFTTGRSSKMTLADAYKYGHSPIRTQLFWIELRDIPLFVASQLVRSHVGVQFFQKSKRTDRGGEDLFAVCNDLAEDVMAIQEVDVCASNKTGRFQEMLRDEILTLPQRFDRRQPTDLAFLANAEALINMAHKRLCRRASVETRGVFERIKEEVKAVDPDLHRHLVPMCVFRNGLCTEPKGCGWIKTEGGKVLNNFKVFFQLNTK